MPERLSAFGMRAEAVHPEVLVAGEVEVLLALLEDVMDEVRHSRERGVRTLRTRTKIVANIHSIGKIA